MSRLNVAGIVVFFIAAHIMLNWNDWSNLFTARDNFIESVNDTAMTEFNIENAYQRILRGQDLFVFRQAFIYPFEVNYALNDPGVSNLIWYIPLRAVMSPPQATIAVILLSIFLTQILMFVLLRKINISTEIALLTALLFAYVPIVQFMSFGHYTYVSTYIYPMAALLLRGFLLASNPLVKSITAGVLGLMMAFVLLLNFYYFISLMIAAAVLVGIVVFKEHNKLPILIKSLKYLPVIFCTFVIATYSWIQALYTAFIQGKLETSGGLHGALDLSADVVGFVTPSVRHPIFFNLLNIVSKHVPIFLTYLHFTENNTVKYAYPGIINLITMVCLLVFRKQTAGIRKKTWIYLFTSMVFAFLLLGPFLKIANRWHKNLDGVDVVIPMPFLLVHYIPGLQGLRAPTRFLPAFVFFASITSAYFLQHVLQNQRIKKYRKPIIVLLFLVFILDQFTAPKSKQYSYFPSSIYTHLKNDAQQGTVLEIPFTLRDGYEYRGSMHSISFLNGAVIHGKPVVGGYFARLQPEVFAAYDSMPFIKYVLDVIDKDRPQLSAEYSHTSEEIQNEIKALNIRYLIIKNDETYSNNIVKLLTPMGFQKIMTDGHFSLYKLSSASHNI